MTVELAAKIPRAELKALGEIPVIKLLGGVELKAFVDIAGGPPTDCRLTMNLLTQLAPLLASMKCFFELLDVITKVGEFATAVPKLPTNPKAVTDAVTGLIDAIDQLKGCIPPLQVPQVALMLKTMLQLVLRFLSDFLEQIDGIAKFRASLDFKSAEGNPALLEALTCAQNSADAAQANLMKSLQPLEPLMNIMAILAGIAQVELKPPDFKGMSAGADASASIDAVKQAVGSLQKLVDSIPG